MLKNVDLHKFETDWVPNDEEREEILRNGNQAKGFIEGSFIGAPTTGALANASRVFDNILNGSEIAGGIHRQPRYSPSVFPHRISGGFIAKPC